MKNLSLLFILVFSIGIPAFAQEEEVPKLHEHQVAINATNFIQTLVSFNGSTFNNTPYDFQYKYLYWPVGRKYGFGMRSGFGYQKSSFNQDQPNSNSTTKSEVTFLDTRIGAEFQYVLNKRWNFFAGWDLVYGKTIMNSSSTFIDFNNQISLSETRDARERSGYGPMVGIQFNINKRLALGTELSMYTVTEAGTRRSTNSSFPGSDQVMYTRFKTTVVQVPSFIYFIVRL